MSKVETAADLNFRRGASSDTEKVRVGSCKKTRPWYPDKRSERDVWSANIKRKIVSEWVCVRERERERESKEKGTETCHICKGSFTNVETVTRLTVPYKHDT